MPIDEKLIQFMRPNIIRRAQKLDTNSIRQKLIYKEIPKAYLLHLRRKNHHEYIKTQLKDNGVYLETDEEQETIAYFYMESKSKPKRSNKRKKVKGSEEMEIKSKSNSKVDIEGMHGGILTEVRKEVDKKQLLVNITNKTKLHINQFGKIVDVLGTNDYLSFFIKSMDDSYFKIIDDAAKLISVSVDDYMVQKNTYNERIFVNIVDKYKAQKLFEKVKSLAPHRNIGMYPVKGSQGSKGSKFKKWSVEINWYEGPRNPRAIVHFSNQDVMVVTHNLLKKHHRFKNIKFEIKDPNERSTTVYQKSVYINLWQNIFGENNFKDEIDLEDTLKEIAQRAAETIKIQRERDRQNQEGDEIFGMVSSEIQLLVFKEDDEDRKKNNKGGRFRKKQRASGLDVDDNGNSNNENIYYQNRENYNVDQNEQHRGEFGSDDEENDDYLRNPNHEARDAQEEEEVYVKKPRSDKEQMIFEYLRGINAEEIDEDLLPKEVIIMKEERRNPDFYNALDIKARETLEEAFPVLEQFKVWAFKARNTTVRRAFVYPQVGEYQTFIQKMRKMLSKHNKKESKVLRSRIKFKFRGVFNFIFDKQLFENFKTTIINIITKYGLRGKTIQKIKMTELKLSGDHDQIQEMKRCVAEINELLVILRFENVENDPIFGFAFTSQQGERQLGLMIINYRSTCLAEYDPRSDEIKIRGTKSNKQKFMNDLKTYYNSFKNQVRRDMLKIKNSNDFLNNSKRITDLAIINNCRVELDPDDQSFIYVYYSMYTSKTRHAEVREFEQDTLQDKSMVIKKLRGIIEIATTQNELNKSSIQAQNKAQKSKDNANENKNKRRKKRWIQEDSSSSEDDMQMIRSGKDKVNSQELIKDLQCSLCCNMVVKRFRLLCGHVFCQKCIRNYLINYNQDGEPKCLQLDCKSKSLCSSDLIGLFTSDELAKIFKKGQFKFMADNQEKFMECETPDCGNILENDKFSAHVGQEQMKKRRRNVIFCDSCGQDYCFNCKKTHYDQDCEFFEEIQEREEIKTELAAQGIESVSCPKCKALVTKSKGCNHMTCKCGCHFCMICGEGFESADNTYDHSVAKHGGIYDVQIAD